MGTPKILEMADRAMDPVGVLVFVGVYFATKAGWMSLTLDEMFYVVIAAGAARSVYEGIKTRHGIRGNEAAGPTDVR